MTQSSNMHTGGGGGAGKVNARDLWFTKYIEKALLKNYRSAQIFMVQHSEPAGAPNTDCTTDLQAIRYFRGSVELAPVHRMGTCNTSRWDQKVVVWQFEW